jgi:hypothetical protein
MAGFLPVLCYYADRAFVFTTKLVVMLLASINGKFLPTARAMKHFGIEVRAPSCPVKHSKPLERR